MATKTYTPFGHGTALTIKVGDKLRYQGKVLKVTAITPDGVMGPYFWFDEVEEGVSYLLCQKSR